MVDHLRADLNSIRDTSRTLQGLAQQLTDVFRHPAGDFPAEAGAADLAAALTAFTGNWAIRQRNLLDDLNDLARVAESAAAALKATDADLAHALDGALTKAETPAPAPVYPGLGHRSYQ